VLKEAQNSKAWFLRCYSLYLAGEKRKEEERIELSGPLGRTETANKVNVRLTIISGARFSDEMHVGCCYHMLGSDFEGTTLLFICLCVCVCVCREGRGGGEPISIKQRQNLIWRPNESPICQPKFECVAVDGEACINELPHSWQRSYNHLRARRTHLGDTNRQVVEKRPACLISCKLDFASGGCVGSGCDRGGAEEGSAAAQGSFLLVSAWHRPMRQVSF
jgi:hypothetical protein